MFLIFDNNGEFQYSTNAVAGDETRTVVSYPHEIEFTEKTPTLVNGEVVLNDMVVQAPPEVTE